MPSNESELGERLLSFLRCGPFERSIKTRRPGGLKWRIELAGGGMMSRWAEGDSYEETLRSVLDEHDRQHG